MSSTDQIDKSGSFLTFTTSMGMGGGGMSGVGGEEWRGGGMEWRDGWGGVRVGRKEEEDGDVQSTLTNKVVSMSTERKTCGERRNLELTVLERQPYNTKGFFVYNNSPTSSVQHHTQ